MPLFAARPDRRRLLRLAGAGVLGLAVGVGATLAVHGLGGRPERAASVQRLALPAGAAPAASSEGGGAVAATPVTAGTARAAVRRFLQASADGDLAVAYGLLDRAGRERYPSLARFTRAQADRSPVSAVRVGREHRAGGGRAEVTVALRHRPAIDPFAGLVPARTVEVWRASRQDGRWRVAADPVSVRAELPGDDRAPEAVSAWVERLLGCDRAGAAGLQAGAELYGLADLAELPCTERGRWTVAAPRASTPPSSRSPMWPPSAPRSAPGPGWSRSRAHGAASRWSSAR